MHAQLSPRSSCCVWVLDWDTYELLSVLACRVSVGNLVSSLIFRKGPSFMNCMGNTDYRSYAARGVRARPNVHTCEQAFKP